MKTLIKKVAEEIYIKGYVRYVKLLTRHSIRYFLNYFLLSKHFNEYVETNKKIIVLNIGAGGEIARQIRNSLNEKCKLIELDIDSQRKPTIIADSEALPFKNESVDIIFIMEVLEHIKNPGKAIIETQRVLKENGWIIGSTPFMLEIHHQFDYYRFTEAMLYFLLSNCKKKAVIRRGAYPLASIISLLRIPFQVRGMKGKILVIISFLLQFLYLPGWFFSGILDDIYPIKTLPLGYSWICKK